MILRSWMGGLTAVCVASCLLVGSDSAKGDRVVPGYRAQNSARHVAILGQVGRSGVYEVPPTGVTVSALVQSAGGLGEDASGNLRVIRRGQPGIQVYYSPQQQYPLFDGDVVVVERRQYSPRSYSPQALVRAPGADKSFNHVTVAVVNLIDRPVVLELIPEQATLRGLLMGLRQPLTPNTKLSVLAPGQKKQEFEMSSSAVIPAFVNGTVIVLQDRAGVVPQNLPALPKVIALLDGGAGGYAGQPGPGSYPGMGPGVASPPRFASAHPSMTNIPTRPGPRSGVLTWNGGGHTNVVSNPRRGSTMTQELPPSEGSAAGSTNLSGVDALPMPGQAPALNGPHVPGPGLDLPAPAGLPNPSEPFLAAPSNVAVGENVAPMGFPAPGMGTSNAAPPMPLIPDLEPQAGEVPVPDPHAVPAPGEDPHATAGPVKGRRFDVMIAVVAGMITLIGLSAWLQRRMNVRIAAQEAAALAAGVSGTPAPVETQPQAERRAPTSETSGPRGSKTAAATPAGAHPVPRPHFSQSPAPTSAPAPIRGPRGAAAYDVVMPPEEMTPGKSGATPERGANGLLDRVLASVQGSRHR